MHVNKINNIMNSPTRHVGKATFLKTCSLTKCYICKIDHIYDIETLFYVLDTENQYGPWKHGG